MFIYVLTNKINGKKYVGQTQNDPFKRWKIHNYNANNPRLRDTIYSGMILYKAIMKYGKESFELEIIEKCENIDQLNEREKFWIKELNTCVYSGGVGYNCSPGGTGYVMSSEIKDKISDSIKSANKIKPGNYGHKHTEETKKKISEIQKGKKRKPLSEESRLKLSRSKKGKAPPKHVLEACIAAKKGSKWSESQREKIKGKYNGKNNPFYGKKHSKESIEKARLKIVKTYILTAPNGTIISCIGTKELRSVIKTINLTFSNKSQNINFCKICKTKFDKGFSLQILKK